MTIIGCDYHSGFQQIAFVDTNSGELQERRLQHREEAERFYRDLAAQAVNVRVGMEASGQARWFERLLAELQVESLQHAFPGQGFQITDRAYEGDLRWEYSDKIF